MDEKIFELLEILYTEVQDIKSNMATKDELANVEQNLKQEIVRLEDKMDANHKALYDGYKLTYEKLEVLQEEVDEINEKIEKQDFEFKVIRTAK
ncbi:MAG: hypothetical protein GX053_01580 [Tissierella sp.]|nr:hypothetical protein [Tissierella sp.]